MNMGYKISVVFIWLILNKEMEHLMIPVIVASVYVY